MVQVKAINTRKVHKVDGHTIFNIVKQMTGEPDSEINRVIQPKLVPMIGRNDADESYHWHRNTNARVSWDSAGQVSWGNALKHLQGWTDKASNYNFLAKLIADGAPTPPAWTDWHKKNKPVPWTRTQKEDTKRKLMTDAIVSQAGWNNRQPEKARCDKLSYADLHKEFLGKNLSSYHWRSLGTGQARDDKLEQKTQESEKANMAQWYSQAWKAGNTRWNPEVLMLAGENQPVYYMSWIIANTYHSTNPDVKNISSYEGRYKYRNWELKERYYPIINSGDTLPKTTQSWPRYSADPKILSIFNLSEMATALKTTFAGKQDMMAGLRQKAKDDHQKQQESVKSNALGTNQIQRTINDVVATGLDTYNERRFNSSYQYYADGSNNYRSRVLEEIPVKERVKIEWIDLQQAMGLGQFNKTIKEYEDRAQSKHNRIVADAKAELDRAKASVAAAKKAAKTKKSKKSSSN